MSLRDIKKVTVQNCPLTVPPEARQKYLNNLRSATKGTGKLFLFAGDQKIEHMHDDFYGPSIPQECGGPEHLFAIASQARIGVFATQLGMISRYAAFANPAISYVVKLNSKTNLVPTSQKDPQSFALHSVADVVEFAQQSGTTIVGVGYTVYLGSEYEAQALAEVSKIILEAHKVGLLVVLWMYPRGTAVDNEKKGQLIAGAAGVGTALGADFVKVNLPENSKELSTINALSVVVQAAGNTGVITAGGALKDEKLFLQEFYDQLYTAGINGCAIGRNIHQKPLPQALAFCAAISALLYDQATVKDASLLLV